MVGDLALESTVDEGEVVGARDVHSRAQLTVRERLVRSLVFAALGAVREDNLREGVSTVRRAVGRRLTWTWMGHTAARTRTV